MGERDSDTGATASGSEEEQLAPDAAAEASARDDEIAAFWRDTRHLVGVDGVGVFMGASPLGAVTPPAWAFGDTPELADELLALVLSGRKRATATALAELEAAGEPVPVAGEVSIVLDGAGHPAALLRTTSVETVPFDQVSAEFAAAEGEDDGSVESWRREHEKYFRRVLESLGREFAADMPVVCERFEVRFPYAERRHKS